MPMNFFFEQGKDTRERDHGETGSRFVMMGMQQDTGKATYIPDGCIV